MNRKVFEKSMLVVFVAVCFSAGMVGQLLVAGEPDEWYRRLNKPDFTPPGWVFGPVWSALYLLMGIAAWTVWRRKGLSLALGLFVVQLILNATWSGLFFGMQRPDLAFAEILVLWAFIFATTIEFFRVSAVGGWLMVPYLAWTAFAAVLNGAIWRMNM